MRGAALTERLPTRVVYADGREEPGRFTLLRERSVLVVCQGARLGLLTCTDTELERLVLGWLYTQRVINGPKEVQRLEIRKDFALVQLGGPLRAPAERRPLKQLTRRPNWTAADVFTLARRFREGLPLHAETGAAHSCLLLHRGAVVCACEDLGRFNAVDKAVGFALEQDLPLWECLLFTSGRVSEELVEKTAAAQIAVLISKAIPTAQAVERARELGVTLICRAWEDRFEVFG